MDIVLTPYAVNGMRRLLLSSSGSSPSSFAIVSRVDYDGVRSTYIQQSRYTGTVDVRVEDTGRDALPRSRQSQVDSDRALADTAFGAADGHYFGDIGYWPFLG